MYKASKASQCVHWSTHTHTHSSLDTQGSNTRQLNNTQIRYKIQGSTYKEVQENTQGTPYTNYQQASTRLQRNRKQYKVTPRRDRTQDTGQRGATSTLNSTEEPGLSRGASECNTSGSHDVLHASRPSSATLHPQGPLSSLLHSTHTMKDA